jgi:hypothetical protein
MALLRAFLLRSRHVCLHLRICSDFYMLLVGFFFGLGQMLQSSNYQSLLGDLTPEDLRGKVVGCSPFFT